MSITAEQSKNKSSRLKADFFEVLIALKICGYYNIDSSVLLKEYKELIQQLRKLKDGQARIDEQEKRAKLALPKIIKTLIKSSIGKKPPIKVIWVGRGWQKSDSLSDIDLIFRSEELIGISLKSTRSGKGTQKNIGASKLKFYLGLDVENEMKAMWIKVRQELVKHGEILKKLSTANVTTIKSAKYKIPIIQKIGKETGKDIQKIATQKSVALFNGLSLESKRSFLDFIFGTKEKNPLLVVLVEGGNVFCDWSNYPPYSSGENIKAVLGKEGGAKGYYIYVDDKSIIRIQVCFTNGIGLSAFCERAFLS